MNSDARILVVDDEPVTRECLTSYFETEGFQVFEAETAEQAESVLSEHTIDVVLLDIRLPGKDGLTLTRELRVHTEVGIILVTGRQDEVDRIIGLECGADEYVTKPFNPRKSSPEPKTWYAGYGTVQKPNPLMHCPTALKPSSAGS
ncbi:response regulator [Aliamphritea spongicola]|nr:response regulator [Aliamphritea spongicola]